MSTIDVAKIVRKRLERLAADFPQEWGDVLLAEAKAVEAVIRDLPTEPRDEHFSTIRSPKGEFVSKLSPQPQRSEHEQLTKMFLDAIPEQPPATDVKEQGSHAANQQESANVHIEHYFPKGYNPDDEPWKSINAHHNAELADERTKTDNLCKWYQQQLAAEREKREKELHELAIYLEGNCYTDPDFMADSRALKAAVTLRQQLLQAQAAIAEIGNLPYRSPPEALTEILQSVDLSALAKHVAEKTKPLVDALTKIAVFMLSPNRERSRETVIRMRDIAKAAIADAKTDRA